MMYRALVGIRGASQPKKTKKERDAYQEQLMKTMLKRWNSNIPVAPYYDSTFDTDKAYSNILKHSRRNIPSNVNVDDPLETMNYIGRRTGHVFYDEIPEDDAKRRAKKKREWRDITKEYAERGEEIPYRITDKYKDELIEPQKSKRTGLYAYSTVNPYGMFTDYYYPILHSYINGITDVTTSKLVNRNYGTMHDILYLGDLDFEGTYLPNIVFRNDLEILESYSNGATITSSGDIIDSGGNPDEIRDFLFETMDRKDYVAIIECKA